MADNLKIGLIGAGRNTRDRHIPGFQKLDNVEITGVANRSIASGSVVAEKFGIPNVYANWQELLADPTIDAVCIGTWPYMHSTITVNALESGKHVLCEARMAATADDAYQMLAASKENPNLVSQIVPSPLSFKIDNLVSGLVNNGYIGKLLAIHVESLGTNFIDCDAPLHWRNERRYSGYNILNMGIWYEAMIRWVGHAQSVSAMATINVSARKDESDEYTGITIPDHVDILARLANGAQARLSFSSVTGHSEGNSVFIYGSEGTVKIDNGLNVYAGKRSDSGLTLIENPTDSQAYWRVEEEFVNAIRGIEPVTRTPFEIGVHYMEFTEAVTRSWQTGQEINLPL
ncbi:MAG TPA: hypothetical protein DEZ08_07320 [Dehalococcoidia bacterium]|jgi:predicted dehydrogenase|nr:hypothetical protein [Dehalococcoidia bacterium]|tara:strand:+ start:3001 stop:4035 length:1035 start_codon:yes stop_codon:yes gene_type:complete